MCADTERASALDEFMVNFGLRADNTWSEWDCVTRVGWRHESRESQVDYLFSSEETTLLNVWVDSSLACDRDHLAVVGTYQTVRNAGVFGTSKKTRIPCALRWTASDPFAWEKAVGRSGEFGADWQDPLAFLGFLARTADAHKRLWSEDVAIVFCGGDEGLSFDRDKWLALCPQFFATCSADFCLSVTSRLLDSLMKILQGEVSSCGSIWMRTLQITRGPFPKPLPVF